MLTRRRKREGKKAKRAAPSRDLKKKGLDPIGRRVILDPLAQAPRLLRHVIPLSIEEGRKRGGGWYLLPIVPH